MTKKVIREFRSQELYGSKFHKVVLYDLGNCSYSVARKFITMTRFDVREFSGKNAFDLACLAFDKTVMFLLS